MSGMVMELSKMTGILPGGEREDADDQTDKPFSLQRDFPLHFLAKMGDGEGIVNYFKLSRADACRQLQRFDFLGRTVLHYAASTGKKKMSKFMGEWQCNAYILCLMVGL
jgi:hypothetical protein